MWKKNAVVCFFCENIGILPELLGGLGHPSANIGGASAPPMSMKSYALMGLGVQPPPRNFLTHIIFNSDIIFLFNQRVKLFCAHTYPLYPLTSLQSRGRRILKI